MNFSYQQNIFLQQNDCAKPKPIKAKMFSKPNETTSVCHRDGNVVNFKPFGNFFYYIL